MKMLKRLTMSRRTMLRGAIGGTTVALGLPVLEAMLDAHGEALADGTALPRRLVTWFWGNGVALNDANNPGAGLRFYPGTTGAGYELTPQLAPFADVREYVSVCSQMQCGAAQPGRRGHHDGCVLLSGHPFIELPAGGANYASKFGGPSIDQVVAERIGSQTFLPSVQLAVSKRIIGSEGPTLQFMSHKGPDQPLSQIFNPIEAWDQMFASFTVPDDPSKPHRINALDAIGEDVLALQARVGMNDKQRLEAHLDSIAQIRSQIDALAPSCTLPGSPGETNEDVEGVEQLASVNEVMTELLRMAFVCDVTRVASLQFTGSVGYTVFPGMSSGHHDLTHEAAQNDNVDAATIFTMEQLAVLLRKLRDSPEGAGNVLDNACLVATSDAASGLTHSVFDVPIIVAGGGGGALTHPGIHYRSESQENATDIMLTAVRSVCPEITELGSANGYSNVPLAALEA
jgi:hypothetical protein